MVWEVIGPSLIEGGLGFLGQERANRANATEARKNRNWQERMSNTAYQRAMSDLKEAGINPMLAAKLGGASTPGGAQATMQNSLASAAEAAGKIPERKKQSAEQQATMAQKELLETKKQTELSTAKSIEQNIRINSLEEEMKTRALEALKESDKASVNAVNYLMDKNPLGQLGSWLGDQAADIFSSPSTSAKDLKSKDTKAKKSKGFFDHVKGTWQAYQEQSRARDEKAKAFLRSNWLKLKKFWKNSQQHAPRVDRHLR